MSLLYGTIAEFRRSIFGTSSIVVQFHRLSNPTLHWLLCRGAFSYNMDAGAFDRMGEWLDPYGEYPDGTPCAYCNSCEGECRPQGWNLIGPICRQCLGDWWTMGSAFIYWRRQNCWRAAILFPLSAASGRQSYVTRQSLPCEEVFSYQHLCMKIAEYAVLVHGRDDMSPRRAQAPMWIAYLRRRASAASHHARAMLEDPVLRQLSDVWRARRESLVSAEDSSFEEELEELD